MSLKNVYSGRNSIHQWRRDLGWNRWVMTKFKTLGLRWLDWGRERGIRQEIERACTTVWDRFSYLFNRE